MRLGVNVDHVATVRQARRGHTPDPVDAARLCVEAGADSIVCHLREDRRHIQDRDVVRLIQELPVPVNLEMSMAPEIVEVALRLRPHQVTLVPERRQELTTEGGLDVRGLGRRLARVVRACQGRKIGVSLFVDPEASQLEAAAHAGARIVELHTGAYANARTPSDRARQLAHVRAAVHLARDAGLVVAAGHGLDYENVAPIARLPHVEELNIGFSIVARALVVGIGQAVREMKAAMKRAGR